MKRLSMLEEIITVHFDEKIKKIYFPELSLRMWRFHNAINQSELMKERWKDPKFRKKASKKHYTKEYREWRRQEFTKYRNSEEGKRICIQNAQKRVGKPTNVLRIPDSAKRKSPFYMIDGIEEETVEMDRVDLSHGVVIESQLGM